MSRYRKLMSEAMAEVEENASDYLKSKLNDRQIQNIKNTWKNKKASDVTQSVKDMIKKMDIPTQLAIKSADIPHLSALVEETAEQIDEGRMKDIYTMDQAGKSAEEIAKKLKVSVATVKGILGEVKEELEDLQEFSRSQLDALQKQYADMKGKTISIDNANKLRKIFDKIPDAFLNDLRKRHIPFLSGLALSRMIQKGMPVKEEVELTESTDINFNPPVDMNTLKKYGTFSGETAGGRDRFFTLKGNNQRMFVIKTGSKIGTLKITAGNRGQDSDKQVKAMAKDLRYKIIDDGDADYNMKKEEVNLVEKEDKDAPATDSTDTDGKETSKIPPIAKDNKPGVKIAKIRAQRDAGDGDPEAQKKEDELKKAKDEVIMLKTKLENEKNKAVKPAPNKETGEVPLAVGLAQKLIRDKMQNQKVVPTEKKENTIFNMWKEAAKTKTDDKEVDKDLEDFEEEITEQGQFQKLMLTYGKPGGQAMVYYTDYMQDLQNRAQEFRKKGYVIGKMGRSVPMNQLPKKMPMKGKEIKEDNIEEKFTVQITKKDGGKVIHGSYKTKPEAEKFIKWYKTGDMKGTKDVKVIPEDTETELDERDGANTSSKKGSVWRKAMKARMKRNYMRPVKRR
tara:strand:- start:671 stop:2533 length:1863 start_codon:yes stop_codon:yes gene_type:complete